MMNTWNKWRRKLCPDRVFVMLTVMICCTYLISAIFQIWFTSMWVILFAVLNILWCVMFMSSSDKHAGFIKLWGWITGLTPVKVMDFSSNVKYTLVEEQPDGTWQGPLHLYSKVGDLVLCANGYVHPECETSFMYIWQPLNLDLRTQLQLAYCETWPDWHAFSKLDHIEKLRKRKEVFEE